MRNLFIRTLPILAALSATMFAATEPRVIALPGKSPIVNIRLVFLTGSAADPAGKEGAANLMAAMLTEGGSKNHTYKELVDALYPMAAHVNATVDKEMITFTAATHVDNLDHFYSLFREMILEPGWRADDFKRIRDMHVNYLRVTLRGNNDEELGKEVLYNEIYKGTTYGHENVGTVKALEGMTIEDLQKFYRANLRRSNLIIGIAGGYPDSFRKQIVADFSKLETGFTAPTISAPEPVKGWHMTMIDKPTRSVAYSFGFPIDVKRGDPDYAALLVAQSYLGQHRNSGGMLYNQMREARGLNYGDYAYIEYFPRGMYRFEPEPNLGRHQQIFQVWVRPVERPTAHFALRLALFEVNKFIQDGISEEDFQKTRSFLTKYVNLLTKTKDAELGYAIDSSFYGISDYNSYVKQAMARLTRDDVNKAIRKHLQTQNMDVVVVADNCAELKKEFLSDDTSPMKYNAPKPDKILEEDKTIEKLHLPLTADAIRIVPVAEVFE